MGSGASGVIAERPNIVALDRGFLRALMQLRALQRRAGRRRGRDVPYPIVDEMAQRPAHFVSSQARPATRAFNSKKFVTAVRSTSV